MRPRRFTRGWSPSYNYSPIREHGKKVAKEPKSKLEKELDTRKFISKQCVKFGVEENFIFKFYDKNKNIDKTISFIFKSSKIKNKCKELKIVDKNYYMFLCNSNEDLDNIIEILNVATGIFKEFKKREINFDTLELIKIVKRYNANFGDVYNWFFKEKTISKVVKKSDLNDVIKKDKNKNLINQNTSIQTMKLDLRDANKICEILGVKIEKEQLIEFIKISNNYDMLFSNIQNYVIFFKIK